VSGGWIDVQDDIVGEAFVDGREIVTNRGEGEIEKGRDNEVKDERDGEKDD
jgi:hypothetical protein